MRRAATLADQDSMLKSIRPTPLWSLVLSIYRVFTARGGGDSRLEKEALRCTSLDDHVGNLLFMRCIKTLSLSLLEGDFLSFTRICLYHA